MTREEAINILKMNNPFLGGDEYESLSEAMDMAVTALQTDNDIVSRQAVIDLIARSMNNLEYDNENEELRGAVMALPSAQPEKSTKERTKMHACDCISRQAAIDVMCLACGHGCDKSKFVYNVPQDEQVIMCPEHYALSTLPSAQPEIIHCGDCRYWKNDHLCECLSRYGSFETEIYFYCGFAERRTDD